MLLSRKLNRSHPGFMAGTCVVLALTLFMAEQPVAHAQAAAAAKRAFKLLGSFAGSVAMAVASDRAAAALQSQPKDAPQAAPVPPSRAEPARTEPSRAEPPRAEPPRAEPPRAEPRTSGYAFKLRWQGPDGVYIGHLVMHGTQGRLLVNSPSGSVDQDVMAMSVGNDVMLIGANPRHAGSMRPHLAYAPDVFRLTRLVNGDWTIADTCDAQLWCAPVDVMEGRVL